MKYTQKSFSTTAASDAYRDNFDRIFRQCSHELNYRGQPLRCLLDKQPEHDTHRACVGFMVLRWSSNMSVPR